MAALTFFTACNVSAQGWGKLENLPETEFLAFELIDGKLFTASGTTLYTSDDQGETWGESEFTNDEEVTVLCFTKFGGKIYAGTSDGVYSAPANDVHSEWNHDILTLPVTSFAERDGVLYASIYGFGAMKLNNNAWMNFSTGLPTMSMNVTRIVNVAGELFAAAGGNGAYYIYDFGAGQWTEHFYFGTIEAGFEVDDAVYTNGALYVSRENNLLRSDDQGETWTEDKEGLPEPANRFMYRGTENHYVFTNNEQNNTVLNYRPLEAVDTPWDTNVETLPWFTYSMRQSGSRLFMAAHDGIYTNEATMTVGPGVKFENTFIYPNPSEDGLFRLQTPLTIDTMNIFDMTGRLIFSAEGLTGLREFVLSQEGVYVVVLNSGDATATQKLIVKK